MGEVSDFQEDDRPESHHGESFRKQEAVRFAHPHRCFTYKLDGREYVVGPVKGVYDKITANSNNKAREHALLVNDRPSYVTILTLGEVICNISSWYATILIISVCYPTILLLHVLL